MSGSNSRFQAYLTVLILYILAFLGYLAVYHLTFRGSILLASLWGDLAATVIVWFFGLLYKNSSLYDPYWSVAPLFIVPFWLIVRQDALPFYETLLLIALFAWGIRLTMNCIVRWSGITHQDWRYTMLKGQSPRWWIITNLMGIHLMPTVLVFLGLIPVYVICFYSGTGLNRLVFALGLSLSLGAMFIQMAADRQMDVYRRRPDKAEYIDEGVWRYSRHPNYFGEILFWWGLWVMQMGVVPAYWYTIAGPVSMTLLFAGISIPMMEKHILATRPAYANYQKEVSVLVPWFRREGQRDHSHAM